jgi:hypothetical protein
LRRLQVVIDSGRLPTIKQLCETTTREFYDGPEGDNYAQARYLCYYLQEKGLLQDFFHKFRTNVATDASGYETLQEVLGNPDMKEFQEAWEEFVMDLRF